MKAAHGTRKPIKTELQLRHLKSSDKAYDIRVANTPGLYIRVGKSGSKSFRWDRGSGQKPRHITYGRFPGISLKQARDAHVLAREQHEDGAIAELVADAPKTVKELGEQFYTDRILPKRKRPEAVRFVLDHDVYPLIGTIRLRAVNALVVRKTVKAVVDRGAVVHAGKTLAILKQMFKYGAAIGVIDSNPAESLDNDLLGIESNQRDRVLNHEELRQFWLVLESSPTLSITAKIALQLLILLGLRSGELRQAQWKDISTKNKTLTIPVENQKLLPKQLKAARPFVVPLDPYALDLLQKLKGLDKVWVFPGAKVNQPFTDKVLTKVVRRLLERKDPDGKLILPIPHFTPHDLRRTLRTELSKLKIQPHVAERCLNHSMGKIMQTYDQYDYSEEHRAALKLWSQQVQIIIGESSNVVDIEINADIGAVG